MNKMIKYFKLPFIFFLLIGMFACTDLVEDLREDLTGEQAKAILEGSSKAEVDALLLSAYRDFRAPFQSQTGFWATQELTADAAIPPTRGGDWDDNGKWRALHLHTVDADHPDQGPTFNNLLKIVFNTTNILTFGPDPSQEAQAKFLRAFAIFCVADGWNQVPVREPGENLLEAPRVLQGPEAVDFVISELNDIMADLPDGPATIANKDAAKVLLMKCYLNKGTFADRSNPGFDQGDMNQVISLADEVIGSPQGYALADNYFDNFAAQNTQKSTELIWVEENIGGSSSGDVHTRWFMTMHYNQNPSGWNGFATLSDFYNKFDPTDTRFGGEYGGVTDVLGVRTGFLEGQQFDVNGNELDDRNGNKLAFTQEIKLIESDNNLEIKGVRVVKYPPDPANPGGSSDNDYVHFRFADVLLMKAEALLRNGDAGSALDIVNEIRVKRGVSTLGSLTLESLLDERGFELYWEGWRRQDLIRFGKFLDAWIEKPATDARALLMPIPNGALAVNPNLTQNPGY